MTDVLQKAPLEMTFTPHFFLIPISFMAGLIAVAVVFPAATLSLHAAHKDGLLKGLSKDTWS